MRYFILFIGLFWLILPIQAQLYPDRHSTGPSDGWLSCTTSPNPVAGQGDSHWIMFDFKTLQQLNTVKMWNHNDPSNLESGVNTITVHYSTDNVVWTELGQFTIPQAGV